MLDYGENRNPVALDYSLVTDFQSQIRTSLYLCLVGAMISGNAKQLVTT